MPDPMPVPPEAVTAALKAAPEQYISLGHWEPIMSRADMRRTLEAAAPHILTAAAERLKAATADEYTAICAEAIIEATVPYEDLLASIWLYVKWHYVTRQLTTPQKELFADAIDAHHARANAEDPDLNAPPVDRWWRPDAPPEGNDHG